ncbi:MAG: hypothetical protein M1837_001222 [Sclerophora amabilis]|nr:MAG: hypothetical protein M1837_001222 [Sclerophora amabilis]
MGRVVRFKEPQTVQELINRVGCGISFPGRNKHLNIATPSDGELCQKVGSVGICAGSGGSILSNLDVDLLFTGEMSHHETLAATQRGQFVIAASHSTSERNFLSQVLENQLLGVLRDQWDAVRRAEASEKGSNGPNMKQAQIEVVTSSKDRDPWGIYPYF